MKLRSVFDKEIVPVRYASSFAIHERYLVSTLSRWYPFLKSIGTDFGVQRIAVRPIFVQHVERTLAAIFSHELTEEQIT